MRKKLLSLLALLCLTAVSAWADGTLEVTEITASEFSAWSGDNTTLSAADLPGFKATTFSEASAWTEAPGDWVSAILIYAFDGTTAKCASFFNGSLQSYNGGAYDAALTRQEIYDAIGYGQKFYYTGAPAVVNLTANSDGAATPSYWATYYNSTISFTADANTTVFQASLSGDQLTLTPVANREIPANEAVILKSSAATITLTEGVSSAALTGNQLVGTTTSITNPGNAYVLNKGTNGVGFYKLSASGTIGANKAYLTYSGGGAAAARGFFLFDETTGIEMPTAEVGDADAVVYDLQGRRVVQPTRSATTGDASTVGLKKGLYIVNGKKVFINK